VACTIRCGTPDDSERVLTLWGAADVLPSSTDDPRAIHVLVARDPEALLVGEVDGQVIATLVVGWDGWRANFYRLAVDPEHRRTGVASALVREAERRLALRGCRRIAATVHVDEQRAVGFWAAVGYGRNERAGRFVKNLS
jgi:ribosomal protein S18 acetylase RimI-like enzyme